jgi:pyrroloquinoline-quinone synthase
VSEIEGFELWTSRMRALADTAGVVTHPFLEQLATQSRAEARADIVKWAMQDYVVSMRFPCILGYLIGQTEDPSARHLLVKNLWEEDGEGDASRSHCALFGRLLVGLGIDNAEIKWEKLNESTRNFIETQEALAKESVLAGLGAFCYANEYITVDEFAPLEKAVEYEFPGADLAFFEANREVDARHAEECEEAIATIASGSDDLLIVEHGAAEALRARVAFYDSLLYGE